MSAGAQQNMSSGDTERSSHQAAAHMGRREEGKGGRLSYRIGYSDWDLAGGGGISSFAPHVLLFFPPSFQKCFSESRISCPVFKKNGPAFLCLVHSPFPLLSHFSSLLFLLSFPTHTHTPTHTCSASLSPLLFRSEWVWRTTSKGEWL